MLLFYLVQLIYPSHLISVHNGLLLTLKSPVIPVFCLYFKQGHMTFFTILNLLQYYHEEVIPNTFIQASGKGKGLP